MISRSPLESFRYGSLVIFLSFLMAGVWYSSAGAAAAPREQQVSATQLTQEMKRALDQIERGYRPRDSRNDPLLLSVKRAESALASLLNDLNRKERRLGSSVGEMGSAVAEVRATYRYMGIKDPRVHAGVIGLSNSWDGFQERFVEKAASTRSRFTDEQRRELQELKAKSNEMDQRLAELRTKVAGDARLSGEMRRMADENRRIGQARADQAGLMTALTTFNAISGWWHALYWTSHHRHDRWAQLLAPMDRWWSGTDAIFAPAYNDYFINIDQTIFNDQWIIDQPISIGDEAALLLWDEQMHSSGAGDLSWQLHNALEHTDGFSLDESAALGASSLYYDGLSGGLDQLDPGLSYGWGLDDGSGLGDW